MTTTDRAREYAASHPGGDKAWMEKIAEAFDAGAKNAWREGALWAYEEVLGREPGDSFLLPEDNPYESEGQ